VWVRAERQTGGRGRRGREWQSPAGNLYASVLVRLRAGDPPAPSLALVAAVALHAALAPLSGERALMIKWPNDLLLGGQKLAGILLEREGDAVVIGIGVNIAHVPEGLEAIATALSSDMEIDPAFVLEVLSRELAAGLVRWREEGLAAVRNAWLYAAHPIGSRLSTSEGDGWFEGLDEGGSLRLRADDGSVRTIHAGDVFLLDDSPPPGRH
jgi:BirA family transcriptional regulator, biotin operon repressor / biotin---[acetyl-CoA-carboxylase] ligase